MLNIINFNQSEPWNFDFYRASAGDLDDQGIADLISESIPDLRSIPFYILHGTVYFYVPTGTTIPEEMLNNIEPITDVLTEADFIANQQAAEAAYQAELAAQASANPTE